MEGKGGGVAGQGKERGGGDERNTLMSASIPWKIL